jgi:hypothetical protein
MKKFLISLVFIGILFGVFVIPSVATAVPHFYCCEGTCDPGEICVGASDGCNISESTPEFKGRCEVVSTGGTAFQKIKECCTLRSNVLGIEVQTDTGLREISCYKGDRVGTGTGIDGCPPPSCSQFLGIGGANRNKAWGIICTLGMIGGITNWIFYFVLILSVLGIIAGGAFYITAMGDPEKASRGKSILTLSAIGIIIAIIARLVPALVRFFVGM